MSQLQPFRAIFFSVLTILPTLHAWKLAPTNVNLSSPPPINVGDSGIINYSPNTLPSTGGTAWPCYSFPVPQDVSRTPFPISGGRVTFTLNNASIPPGAAMTGYHYTADIYLGQISLGDGLYTAASQDPGNAGYSYLDQEVFSDFPTGQACSRVIDVVGAISSVLGYNVTAARVAGMNATVGVRMEALESLSLQEEMYQCGYVTFTNEDLSQDPNAGYCNSGASPTVSSTAAPSTLPTSYPSPPPHAVSEFPAATTDSHTVAIGVGVGVSMGVSLLILIVAFLLVRRRKARKHSEMIGADGVVAKQYEPEGTRVEKGHKVEAVESSGILTDMEPPPPYESHGGERST